MEISTKAEAALSGKSLLSRNLVVMTGLLIQKDRNADNIDIKRPILDFEIITEVDCDLSFEQIPVLLPGGALARSAAGCTVGTIYLICGELRTIGDKVCVEAKKLAPVTGEKKKANGALSVVSGRAELLHYTMMPNVVSFVGTIETLNGLSSGIRVKRNSLTQGDLTDSDIFNVWLPEEGVSVGDVVLCTGEIQADCIILNDILKIG